MQRAKSVKLILEIAVYEQSQALNIAAAVGKVLHDFPVFNFPTNGRNSKSIFNP